MTITTGLDIPTHKLAEVCRRYQISQMSLLGSAARGELGPESDVDVLVEFEPNAVWGLDYFGLEQELAQLLGRRVDLATKKWLKPAVRERILRDARVIWSKRRK